MRQLKFRLNWIPQGPNSPFLHAADAGYFAEAGVEPVFSEARSSASVVADIASGLADIGFGDIPATFERAARSASREVVALMPVYARSPSCLGYLDTGSPLRLADLQGAALAGPSGDTTARLLPLLLARNGLADLTCDLTTVDAETRDLGLYDGRWQAVTCFDATLRFSLAARGLPLDRLRFLYLADHGLDMLSAGLLACEAVATDAALVEGLRAAVRRGWEDCRRDPGLGVAAVQRRLPDVDPDITRAHLQWVLDNQVYARDGATFGTLDPAMIDATLAALDGLSPDEQARARGAIIA